MLKRKVMFGSMVCLVSIILASLVLAAPTEEPRGRGGRGGGQRMNRDQMRARMVERMKEQLGAKDEEWKVIEPRLRKVMDLSRQAGGFGRRGRGMFSGQGGQRGGPRDRGPGRDPGERPDRAPDREMTAVEKAGDDLQKVLDSASAKPEEIKAKLTALRTAREKAKKELAEAQKELQQILTVKQEATLVLAEMLN